jgi:hypothetical protein
LGLEDEHIFPPKLGVALLLLLLFLTAIFSLAAHFQTPQYMFFPCTVRTQFTLTKKIKKLVLLAGLGTAQYILVTTLWAGRSGVCIPAEARGLSVVRNVSAGCMAHPSSYTMGTGRIIISRGKAAGP